MSSSYPALRMAMKLYKPLTRGRGTAPEQNAVAKACLIERRRRADTRQP